MAFEKIVRPAQSPDNTPAKQETVRIVISSSSNTSHRWGVGGQFKQMQGSFSSSASNYTIRRPKEQAI